MSIWAGIKHALNSTLGKSNFKPLDKIIKNNAMFVKGNTEIWREDFHLYQGFGGSVCEFVPNIGGELTFKLSKADPNVEYIWDAGFTVQTSDNKILYKGELDDTTAQTISLNISESDIGKIIAIYVSRSAVVDSNNGTLPFVMTLCADIIPCTQFPISGGVFL